MGYTIYHKFRSEWQEELVNKFYRNLLGCMYVKWKSLLNLFWDNEVKDNYFHEFATDDKWLPAIDTNPEWWFTKTARKKYDIAIVLTYLFDDLLSGWDCTTDGDYEKVSEWYVKDMLEAMIQKNDSWLSTALRRYIKQELQPYFDKLEEYTEEEVKDVVWVVMKYCEEEDIDEDELYDKTHQEPDDTDLEHIWKQVADWYKQWERRNWWRSIDYWTNV